MLYYANKKEIANNNNNNNNNDNNVETNHIIDRFLHLGSNGRKIG